MKSERECIFCVSFILNVRLFLDYFWFLLGDVDFVYVNSVCCFMCIVIFIKYVWLCFSEVVFKNNY